MGGKTCDDLTWNDSMHELARDSCSVCVSCHVQIRTYLLIILFCSKIKPFRACMIYIAVIVTGRHKWVGAAISILAPPPSLPPAKDKPPCH